MSRARRLPLEPVLLAVCVLAGIAALWSVDYFPSQDGPAHVDSANVLRLYLQPSRDDVRAEYRLLPEPVPNLTGQLILAGLLSVVPPSSAEKLMLSLYLLLFPLAFAYAVGREAGARWLLDTLNREGRGLGTRAERQPDGTLRLEWA